MARHPNTTPQGAVTAFDQHPAQQALRDRPPTPQPEAFMAQVWDPERQGFRIQILTREGGTA
jgi:hypothetical protein